MTLDPTILLLSPATPFDMVVRKGVAVGEVLDRMPARRLFLWCYVLMAAAGSKLFLEAARSLVP